jgi:hypothetical protein
MTTHPTGEVIDGKEEQRIEKEERRTEKARSEEVQDAPFIEDLDRTQRRANSEEIQASRGRLLWGRRHRH